jgi:hypothetical protein
VTEHLIEGEVVEDIDQLGIGHRQGGDVAGKQFVMIFLCMFIGSHCRSPRDLVVFGIGMSDKWTPSSFSQSDKTSAVYFVASP